MTAPNKASAIARILTNAHQNLRTQIPQPLKKGQPCALARSPTPSVAWL
ncbi:MAG: hypothetical protein KME32_20085 [Mojavia pulchra JT2-VF2]|uniref:Uncharacterized protein n=1 Tax=Mojavia pulchra JT2-VF2 TaxID=287848 RepID=A0A951Q1W8_9NOST|nr:hypothetical protein [Mojavia pulchra JT2-VF2]